MGLWTVSLPDLTLIAKSPVPSINLAKRRFEIDSSGIRKVFDLAANLKDPCNLSIGLPDYDVPEPVKEAAIAAIREGRNRYTLTAGVPRLRETVRARYHERGHEVEDVIIASGTSGGLFLCFLALLNPGDGLMFADPYFVMYKHLCKFIGAVPAYIDTYPDFRLRREALERAWTPSCKVLIINSPNNPAGVVYTADELRMAAEFAEEKGLVVVTDEIYEDFVFDGSFDSPANYTNPERTVIISGLSKNVAMTGWRIGWVAGPAFLIQALSDIQQYSFVCAPAPAQAAAFSGLEVDMTEIRQRFTERRDLIYGGLKDAGYDVEHPGGAFYILPAAPCGDGDAFVRRAIDHNLLVVPGSVFSERKTHFRISFAAGTDQLQRGIRILRELNSGSV